MALLLANQLIIFIVTWETTYTFPKIFLTLLVSFLLLSVHLFYSSYWITWLKLPNKIFWPLLWIRYWLLWTLAFPNPGITNLLYTCEKVKCYLKRLIPSEEDRAGKLAESGRFTYGILLLASNHHTRYL